MSLEAPQINAISLKDDKGRKQKNTGQRTSHEKRRTLRKQRSIPRVNSTDLQSSSSGNSGCRELIGRLLNTVCELEHSLIEDQEKDYKLRMALTRQTEKVYGLRASLANEKERNQRLVDLIRAVDSTSSAEEDSPANPSCPYGNTAQRRGTECYGAYASISPLLMQQRYDELSTSYRKCQRQLSRKEKQLTLSRAEKEAAQSRYDHLLEAYCEAQKRFEDLCGRYLRLQARKNYEVNVEPSPSPGPNGLDGTASLTPLPPQVHQLHEALSCASDCVISAQQVLDDCRNDNVVHCCQEFHQNLQLFVRSLGRCGWARWGSAPAAGGGGGGGGGNRK